MASMRIPIFPEDPQNTWSFMVCKPVLLLRSTISPHVEYSINVGVPVVQCWGIESMVLLHGWFHWDNWKHRTLLSYILIVHAVVAERRLERRVDPIRSSPQNLETIDPDLYPHPPLSEIHPRPHSIWLLSRSPDRRELCDGALKISDLLSCPVSLLLSLSLVLQSLFHSLTFRYYPSETLFSP
jgi:hypothetical protein